MPEIDAYRLDQYRLDGGVTAEPAPGEQVYNVPGTFTFIVPDDVFRINARIWGAGGGGGGSYAPSPEAYCGSGGGGGAGAYLMVSFPVIPGEVLDVSVGNGGKGGIGSGNGTAGLLSSVGKYKAYGGGGGGGAHNRIAGYAGGGGTLTAYGNTNYVTPSNVTIGSLAYLNDSDVQISGWSGSTGYAYAGWPGAGGGGSPGDAGYRLGWGVSAEGIGLYYPGFAGGAGGAGIGADGSDGSGVGAGGGGASGSGSTSKKGGNGGDGKVIISW